MVKSVHFKKFIIAILIIALTFSNWGVLGGYVIAKASEELELQTSETKNPNVKFDIGIKSGEKFLHQFVGDISGLAVLSANISVQNSGYLKDISITFEGESGEDKNFNIIEVAGSDNSIQRSNKNIVQLNQIEANKTITIDFSIRRTDKIFQDFSYLDKNNIIKFIATYVTDEGNEIKIEKTVLINIAWKCENNIVLEARIVKYAQFQLLEGTGVILTEKLLLSQDKVQGLPYKNIEIETEEIKLNEKQADKIIIKQGNRDIEFEKNEDGNIKFIDNEQNNETTREYTITYVFKNTEIEESEISSKTNAKVLIYSSDGEKQAETEIKEILKETIENNVSIEGNKELSISKGKISL